MSYEGREVYICPHGHVHQINAVVYYYDMPDEDNIKCPFCSEVMKQVGDVDDTNGEAAAPFYLKTIREEKIDIQCIGSGKNAERIIHVKPGIYEVVTGEKGEWFNFDTGEKL